MAASSALTLLYEKTLGGGGVLRAYSGTADDQTAVAHNGPGVPYAWSISDFLDTEVACGISAVSSTQITYGAAGSTTARIFLWFDDMGAAAS